MWNLEPEQSTAVGLGRFSCWSFRPILYTGEKLTVVVRVWWLKLLIDLLIDWIEFYAVWA